MRLRSWSFFLSHPYPSSIRWGPKPIISSATSAQPARCAPVPKADPHRSLPLRLLVELFELLVVLAEVALFEVVVEILVALEFVVFVELVVLKELLVSLGLPEPVELVIRHGLEFAVVGEPLLPLHGRLGLHSWRVGAVRVARTS